MSDDYNDNDQHVVYYAAALNHYIDKYKKTPLNLAHELASIYEKMGEPHKVESLRRQIYYAMSGNPQKGRKGVGRKQGEMIAKLFDSSYDGFLMIGRELVEKKIASSSVTDTEKDSKMQTALFERVRVLLNSPPIIKSEPTPEYVPIPVAATALSAGSGNLVYQDELTSVKNYFHQGWLLGKCAGGVEQAVIFKVDGNSMSPTIEHDSEVLVDMTPTDEWQSNKIYAIRQDNEVRIKRLLRSKQSDMIIISSDNPEIDANTGTRRYEDE